MNQAMRNNRVRLNDQKMSKKFYELKNELDELKDEIKKINKILSKIEKVKK